MAWSATAIGCLLGLGTQMYSNALRKLPYMRRKSFYITQICSNFQFYTSSRFNENPNFSNLGVFQIPGNMYWEWDWEPYLLISLSNGMPSFRQTSIRCSRKPKPPMSDATLVSFILLYILSSLLRFLGFILILKPNLCRKIGSVIKDLHFFWVYAFQILYRC